MTRKDDEPTGKVVRLNASPSERKQTLLVSEFVEIEKETALSAGTVGYMARAMVQATMPHRRTDAVRIIRRNGDFQMTMMAGFDGIPLPYGALPRLMLAWMGAEALKTGNPVIDMGDSMSAFMSELGMYRTGGKRGAIKMLKLQAAAISGCAIRTGYISKKVTVTDGVITIGQANLWWEPAHDAHGNELRSSLTLSPEMFREITSTPVPVDLRVLKMLRESPMQMDVYSWLTYRIFTLNNSRGRDTIVVPWQGLQGQFGAGYPSTPQGLRDFKKNFLKALNVVCAVAYPEANVEPRKAGLEVRRSPQRLPSRPPRKPHQKRVDKPVGKL